MEVSIPGRASASDRSSPIYAEFGLFFNRLQSSRELDDKTLRWARAARSNASSSHRAIASCAPERFSKKTGNGSSHHLQSRVRIAKLHVRRTHRRTKRGPNLAGTGSGDVSRPHLVFAILEIIAIYRTSEGERALALHLESSLPSAPGFRLVLP